MTLEEYDKLKARFLTAGEYLHHKGRYDYKIHELQKFKEKEVTVDFIRLTVSTKEFGEFYFDMSPELYKELLDVHEKDILKRLEEYKQKFQAL